ncbi:MAG: hypothetical protein OXI43_10060 [Candidatus Poribacteria bacterium]|nr:hypothetical protein [Candidatus Poribacteria bacterium]
MEYDKDRYEIWTLRNPYILFYVLFPGTIITELILGHRIPKVMLIDKKSDKPWMERTYVPCPHCQTLNDGRLWAKTHSVGHWFGLLCASCHQVIPCLWGIFSLAILVITFPLRYFPARFFRPRWIEIEKKRIRKATERPLIQAANINWRLIGAGFFGGFMWLFMTFIPQAWDVYNGKEWDLMMLLVGFLISTVMGLFWGVSMHHFMNRKGD